MLTVFTQENLAILGLLDETHDLYRISLNIVLEGLNNWRQTPSNIPNPFLFLELSHLCKKELNSYFNKNIRYFYPDFHKHYINDKSLKACNFSLFNHSLSNKNYLVINYDGYISFNKFLEQLENLLFVTVFRRVCSQKPMTSQKNIIQTIQTHLSKQIEEKKASQSFYVPTLQQAITLAESSINVYVYQNPQNMLCIKNQHKISSRTLTIPLLEGKRFINLPVRYCDVCKKYFVSMQTLNTFEDMYGKMLLRTHIESFPSDESFFKCLGESELHQFGYNVIDGNNTEDERYNLIKTLITYRLMTPESICRDIENALRLFKNNPKMHNALTKWNKDLYFVRQLCLTTPSGIGRVIQPK